MSKSDAFESALLSHIFLNTAIANVGDAAGLPASATAGSLHLSLHTADPGEAGNQSTSEVTTAAYTGYTRMAVARSAAGFTVTADTLTLTSDVSFPAATGGTGATITHLGIGTSATGTGTLLYKLALTPTVAVANGVQPIIRGGTGNTNITES